MKVYSELSSAEQKQALNFHLGRLLEAIIEGAIRFNDELNHDDLQARIDRACNRADKMHTPWFAHEYILDTCRDELEGMAQCSAEDCMYSEGEQVVSLQKVRNF